MTGKRRYSHYTLAELMAIDDALAEIASGIEGGAYGSVTAIRRAVSLKRHFVAQWAALAIDNMVEDEKATLEALKSFRKVVNHNGA